MSLFSNLMFPVTWCLVIRSPPCFKIKYRFLVANYHPSNGQIYLTAICTVGIRIRISKGRPCPVFKWRPDFEWLNVRVFKWSDDFWIVDHSITWHKNVRFFNVSGFQRVGFRILTVIHIWLFSFFIAGLTLSLVLEIQLYFLLTLWP